MGSVLIAPAAARAQDGPIIAAASDLNFALTEVADVYARESGRRIRLSFGSSGNFARQIAQGAPFEMFLSADENYVQGLAARGLTLGDGDLYAIGRLVIFVPHDSPVEADPALADLATALSDGRLRRLAIANPEHAPYGRAAREALMAKGIWQTAQGKLVLGENVSQAAQFATTGNAEAGLFAYSLALSPSVSGLGRHALLPENLHAPLRQRMVLLKRAGDDAKRFYGFVQQPAARAILARYGFVLPPAGG
jgi:molybdate transport system substrate-binding protein